VKPCFFNQALGAWAQTCNTLQIIFHCRKDLETFGQKIIFAGTFFFLNLIKLDTTHISAMCLL
jgi:hypothetical protein